jgi:hypothetical protein
MAYFSKHPSLGILEVDGISNQRDQTVNLAKQGRWVPIFYKVITEQMLQRTFSQKKTYQSLQPVLVVSEHDSVLTLLFFPELVHTSHGSVGVT